MEFLFPVSVMCCQIDVSETRWSLVQRKLTVVRCCVWSRNLKNEEAITHVGPQRHRKKILISVIWHDSSCIRISGYRLNSN